MAIERRLTEIVGPLGGKLHTGRSRNDQVATDLALYVARARRRRRRAARGLRWTTLLELAERHRDWRLPGYTHLQRAQPVSLGHHLLAWFWMLRRDADRFAAAARLPPRRCRSARGALAGPQLGARSRGGGRRARLRRRVVENSIDAVSNRDFALDYLSAASACATHMSRIGAEIVLWSTQRVRLLPPRRGVLLGLLDHASEDEPRRRRAPAGQGAPGRRRRTRRSPGSCTGCRSPTPRTCRRTRSRSSTRSTRSSSACGPSTGCSRESSSTASGWQAAAGDEMAAATDVADLLVRRGMPFREAHGVVGGLVRHALERGVAALADGRLRPAPLLGPARRRVLRGPRRGLLARLQALAGRDGGEAVSSQLELAAAALAHLGG